MTLISRAPDRLGGKKQERTRNLARTIEKKIAG